MPSDPTPMHADDRAADQAAIERVTDVLRQDPKPGGLRAAVELDLVLGRLERQLDRLRAGVEQALELPTSQLYVLRALDDGAVTAEEVARATPLSPAAAATEVEQLRADRLLAVSGTGDQARLALTARGRARLGQAEALRLRVLAELAGEADADTLRAVAELTNGPRGPG